MRSTVTLLENRGNDILCFSQLRWDGVWQRPQHLLTRLVRRDGGRIFFIEEPLPAHRDQTGAERPGWHISEVAPGITRCVPLFDVVWPNFIDDEGSDTTLMRGLLEELVQLRGVQDPIAWVYTPLALPLLRDLDLRAVIYDCMDELALFAGAPPELALREAGLLRRADVVFAGGLGMYEARVHRHPNVHFFPSSVDCDHFAQALDPATPIPLDARPGTPTLGFYGVLDERLDLTLLDACAALRPDWQFVFVGPVVKIAPEDLPRRSNLHYPGQRDYADLPCYLKGWDVCLMPFALNDATRFISPTKTLEYLAADKPIVSTSVPDVIAGYGGVVRFADDPDTFIAQCEAALGENALARAKRIAASRALLARTSWDATVDQMAELLDEVIVTHLAGVADD
jgi:glycosyltransferase involved in cell wall biosynthesis